MSYKELQAKLKKLKLQGLTDIKLNSSKEVLEQEYCTIIESLENEQKVKETVINTPTKEITKEIIENNFRRSDSVAILTLLGFMDNVHLKSLRSYVRIARNSLRYDKFQLTLNNNKSYTESLKIAIELAEKALDIENIKLRRAELIKVKKAEHELTKDSINKFIPPEKITKRLIEKIFDGKVAMAVLTLLELHKNNDVFFIRNLHHYLKTARFCLKSCNLQLTWYEAHPDHKIINHLKTCIYILENALKIDIVKSRHSQLRDIQREVRNRH